MSSLLEDAVLQLRKEVPLQLVVNMFQKMVCGIFLPLTPRLTCYIPAQNLRHVIFSQEGKLTGLVTKRDIVWLLTAHLPHTGALSNPTSS